MALKPVAAYPLPRDGELPVARASWQLQPARAALLVHDMQGYFLAVYQKHAAPLAPMLAYLRAVLERCRALGIPVFYTAQRGNQDRRDRGLQADWWGPGMQAVPEHEAIADVLAPAAGDQVLVKHRYSAFQRSNLAELLRARGRDQLLLTGVYAHIGILATAAEAFQRDIQPFVAADAVADLGRAEHDQALAWIAASCGVPMTTRAVLEALQ